MTNKELINRAKSVLRPHKTKSGRLHGDVGAAVLSRDGNVYFGVAIDAPGWGLCAERSALAGMVSNGEYKLKKIVAVWRNNKTKKFYILPPCGICRQFMRDIDESNMKSEIILGENKAVELERLIPYHKWPKPIG